MIDNISVVIIAKDAQDSIKKTLDSLIKFSEVILYLNDTTDDTKKIAQSYNNVKVIDGEFSGFGPTKNIAASFSTNDWILSLDSDEVLSEDFIEELVGFDLSDAHVYSINRVNFYKLQQIKHCWADDIIVRLYNKRLTAFNDSNVHEKIIDDKFTNIIIKSEVEHYPYLSVSDFIKKLDRYSSIFANEWVDKKTSSPTKAILNGSFSFFKTYILKRGFLDGYAGLIIAFSHMATNFYKYIKLYELNIESKK